MHYKDPANNLHAIDSTEFEYFLPAGSVQITADEASDITASKIIQPTYQELRAAAYPPITDLADAVAKGGKTLAEYQAACLAVKAQYPKPAKI